MSIVAAIVVPKAGPELSELAGAGVKLVHAEPEDIRVVFEGLGSDASETWVVTTSDDAVYAARDLGLRVCAVLNEGEALAQGAMSTADIVAHGWREVSFGLLDDFACGGGVPASSVCRVLIVCGSPDVSSSELVRSLAAESDYVVACDSGANACMAAGVVPQAFVGDGDSSDPDVLAWVESCVDRRITFPAEKYATDLALAIDAARHEATRQNARLALTLTCATGGRPDHALAVLGLLTSAVDAAPRIVEDGFELRLLAPEGTSAWFLGEAARNHTLSVVALAPDTVVSEFGLRWELDRRELPLLGDEGVSNIVTSNDAEVTCHSGVLAVYLLLSH